MKRIVFTLLVLLLILAGCGEAVEDLPGPWQPQEPDIPEYREFDGPTPEEYVNQVVVSTAKKLSQPGMSEYEQVKAAFDYLIEVGCYRWSPALDLWRIRTTDDAALDFVQMRAVSFLTHGMGTCEDYSSALVMLLREMGMEAQYMPGLTYSAEGDLVYHAWTLAKVDGIWYHLDCELEDGISDDGLVHYKYFMRSDQTMLGSHLWGQALIDSGRMKEGQNAEIAERYLGEPCPQDYPTPPAQSIPVTKKPDESAVMAIYMRELEEYESAYGRKEYRELDILPPVFGRYGGYSTEAGFADRSEDYVYDILTRRLLIREGQP